MRFLPAGDDTDVLSVSSDDDTAAKPSVVAHQDVVVSSDDEAQAEPCAMGLWLSTSPCLCPTSDRCLAAGTVLRWYLEAA